MSFFSQVCPATAMYPGSTIQRAVSQLSHARAEVYGALSFAHIQLCPQHHGVLDEATCDTLMESLPHTQFRLHANLRLFPSHHFFDASTYGPNTAFYYRRAAALSQRLNAPAFSLHAGRADMASEDELADTIKRLTDLFCVPVAVEFLYPVRKGEKRYLLSDWAGMERWLDTGLPFALDLSHINIVATTEGRRDDLLRALLSSPQLIELHISGNDGRTDRHLGLQEWPWWHEVAASVRPSNAQAVTFTESNHIKPFLGLEVA